MSHSTRAGHRKMPAVSHRKWWNGAFLKGVGTAAVVGAGGLLGSTALSAHLGTMSLGEAPLVSTAPVVTFQAAGSVGGGPLEPGTTYPPTTQGSATLTRGNDWVQVTIQTSGLPPGAYTVWWVVFGNPAACRQGCDSEDLFTPAVNASVFWATGGVVRGATTRFRARHRLGDDLGEPGAQHVMGNGRFDPRRAEIHNVIKYHGPASDDSDTLHSQTHTLLGGCDQGANAVDLGPPFGVQCFDPQVAVHPRP